jgi:hypothetical protein
VKTYLFQSFFRTELEALSASLTASGAVCADIQKITKGGIASWCLKAQRAPKNTRTAQIMRDLRDAPLRPDQRAALADELINHRASAPNRESLTTLAEESSAWT